MGSSACHQKQGNHGDSPHRQAGLYHVLFSKAFPESPKHLDFSCFLNQMKTEMDWHTKRLPPECFENSADVNCTRVCCATWTLSNYVSLNTHSLNNGHYTIISALQTHSNAHLHTNKLATAHLCRTLQCLSEHLDAHRGSCLSNFLSAYV